MYRNSVLTLTSWQQILYKRAAKRRNSFIIYSLIFLVIYIVSNAILAIKLNIILTSCHVIIKEIMQRLNDNSSIVQLLAPKINTIKTLKLINIFCNILNIDNANTVIILTAIIRKNPALAAIVDGSGRTALHLTAIHGQTEIALALISANPELAAVVDNNGRTVLHFAAKSGQTEVALAIISANPELVAVADGMGWTALHFAARRGQTEIALLLISANPALAAVVDNDGNTALHVAASNWHTEVVLALISANPALVAVVDGRGRTALHLAAMYGKTEVAAVLIAITNNTMQVDLSLLCIDTMDIAVKLINNLKMNKNILSCTFRFGINAAIKTYLDCEMNKIYQRNHKYADKCMADILSSVIRNGTDTFRTEFTPTASQYQYLTKAAALIKHRLTAVLGTEAAADKILKDIDTNFTQAFAYTVGICNVRRAPEVTFLVTAMSMPDVSSKIAGFLGKDELERLRLLAIQKPAAAIIVGGSAAVRGESVVDDVVVIRQRHEVKKVSGI